MPNLKKHLADAAFCWKMPESPAVFGIFRVMVALFCLVEYAILYPDLLFHFGKTGPVLWEINDAIVAAHLPTFGKTFTAFHLENWISADSLVVGFYWIFMASLIGLAVGWKARFMAATAWFLHLVFASSGRLGTYGVESFASVALFYACFFPCHEAFSLDRWLKKMPAVGSPSVWAGVSLRVLQGHLCVVYLASGLEKSAGDEWWNGNAIWFSMMEEQFRQFDFSWMASWPIVPMMLGWATLLTEIGYPFFIFWKKTRRLWLAAVICLHLGIVFFMGLQLFGLMMILLNLAAFGRLERISVKRHLCRLKLKFQSSSPSQSSSVVTAWPPVF